MNRIILIIACSLFLCSFTKDQSRKYPTDYFRSPVDYAIYLSGTFGELRPNHFHAGIDIKGSVGKKLYSIADAYVSRIKVQEGGYGNVLYLDHPNGFTSVYAHMDEFAPEIAAYVKSVQQSRQTFEVELFPPKDQFLFKKGDPIGKMGISGRSFGPHLHFEIRDTKTEQPINPLFFGFKVKDTRAPRLHEIRVYQLSPEQEVLDAHSHNLIAKGNEYGVRGDTLMINAWRAGFGLKAYDHMNGVNNWNGIFELKMWVDDELAYQFDMETFAFNETRYLNAHLDYEEQVSKKSYFNRCFKMPGNQLSIYEFAPEQGIIALSSKRAKKITMVASDINGNERKLEFWAKRKEQMAEPPARTYNYKLPFDEENVIETASIRMHFPKGTFYENMYLNYHAAFEDSYNVYSAVHQVHDYKTPVHKFYDIAIRPTRIPENMKSKAFIAYCDQKNRVYNCGGQWTENGMIKTKVRDLGNFYVMVDNTPPTIRPSSFRKDMRGRSRMTFKINDNLLAARNVTNLHYNAWIDGQWVLMQFDAKNNLLIHEFEKDLPKGEHQLRLEVKDAVGNVKVYENTFLR